MAKHNIIHNNICAFCGKDFRAKFSIQKYCSKKCVRAARDEREKENGQICWRCRNAYCKCSWTKNLIPVPGWEAEKITVIDDEGNFKTYRIKKCPLFDEEG